MKRRALGLSGLEIAPIVFGGNVFGWTVDEAQSFCLLDACVEHGINMIDTADVYSAWAPGNKGGESEAIIGKWLKQSGKRDQVVIATKVGMPLPRHGEGLAKSKIISGVEASLKRLQTDHIDLYYAHKDDTLVPFEETFSAFDVLIKSGKVRAIASSNYSAERLKAAMKFSRENNLPAYVAHQPEYNLVNRQSYETDIEVVCQEFNQGVVTYFSLASGFLSGKYRKPEDFKDSKRAVHLARYMTPKGLKTLEVMDEIAQTHSISISTVAIAWILARPSVTAPIVSATTTSQLSELGKAADIALTPDEVAKLNAASAV